MQAKKLGVALSRCVGGDFSEMQSGVEDVGKVGQEMITAAVESAMSRSNGQASYHSRCGHIPQEHHSTRPDPGQTSNEVGVMLG